MPFPNSFPKRNCLGKEIGLKKFFENEIVSLLYLKAYGFDGFIPACNAG
ncbi:hypothetical protein ATE92_0845 [Ulvibacter sp. MAR_2010_11]|nr:hypothetical protein ATE92_0845 [Ulvibacter sp. MAR_2010_11]